MANTIGTINAVTKKVLPAPKAVSHPHKNLGGYLHPPKKSK